VSARFVFASLLALTARAGDLPQGQLIEGVDCTADATQSYALYIPSLYRAAVPSAVVIAFDPGGRGRVPVERFQKAAEMYGYIVAGSNNSRNGSLERSVAAAQAMWRDVAARFTIDSKRIYSAGMSGGARVAMNLALGAAKPENIGGAKPESFFAGVIACSAGFPDATPRKTVPFAVFGTAGTEDFNYLEMRALDRELISPHRVVIFEGGHAWLSSDLAVEAIEWMEIQAMRSGRRAKDPALIDRVFAKRSASIGPGDYVASVALAADFEGLHDVVPIAESKAVRDAIKHDRELEQREERLSVELNTLAQGDLRALRTQLKDLKKRAGAPDDSPDRRMARRIVAGFSMGVRESGPSVNPELRKLVEELRKP
jgi:dienelactone hydrolase